MKVKFVMLERYSVTERKIM